MRTLLPGLALAMAAPAGAQEPGGDRPLSVADALSVARFADRVPLALSPDGQWVAFTLQDPRRAAEQSVGTAYFDDRGAPRGHRATDVYVADLRTGSARRVSGGEGSSWGGVWSPDGRYLSFYSDRDGLARVWLWERGSDRATRLSDAVVRPFWGFEQLAWSPDGGRLLVKLAPEGVALADLARLYPGSPSPEEPGNTSGLTARAYHHPPEARATRATAPSVDIDSTPSFLNVQLGDLALIDVPSGRVRRLARGVRAIGYRFSPGGDRVGFTVRQPDDGTGTLAYNRYDLSVVDTLGAVTLLAPRTVQSYGLGFSWSPDGAHLAYQSGGSIHVSRVSDGTAVRSLARDGTSFDHEYRPPLWLGPDRLVLAAENAVWSLGLADGAMRAIQPRDDRQVLELVAAADAQQVESPRVLIAVRDARSKRVGFQSVDLDAGTVSPVFEADLGLGATDLTYHLVPRRDGSGVLFVAETGERPPDVWMGGGPAGAPRRVTDLHPAVSRLVLGRSQLIEWKDGEGRPLQGALLLPAGHVAGKRYPLVVKVYGGSLLSGRVNRFGLEAGVDNLQLLASRGYAVLLPDAPTRVGTPMADIAAAVLSGVGAVVAMGIADPDRVAVIGHSYGGYSALAVAVRSDRIHAVVSSAGFSNLLSQYGQLRPDGSAIGVDWAERRQGQMGGHPWEYPERYRDNSPFFFLGRISAPVLLLHGGGDRTVLPERAQETFVGLRRLGKTVSLVIYDGEDHHPGTWSVENATDWWERIFAWLDRHLRSRR